MHLGNGALTPGCAVVAMGVAAAAVGVATVTARALKREPLRARQAAVLGAAVFAAQMFNFPLLPYSSAHLIGGVLLAWMLGPAIGLLTMCAILSVQALALGDGGLLALGANILNMGVLPAGAVTLVNRWRDEAWSLHTAGVLACTAFVTTVCGALLVVLEVSVGRSSGELTGLGSFASAMIWSHVAAGALEALATVAIVTALVSAGQISPSRWSFSPAKAAGLLAISLAVALLSVPEVGLASALPDGYESAVAASAMPFEAAVDASDSSLIERVSHWQDATVTALAGPPLLLAAFTTLMTAALVAGCAAALRAEQPARRRPASVARHWFSPFYTSR